MKTRLQRLIEEEQRAIDADRRRQEYVATEVAAMLSRALGEDGRPVSARAAADERARLSEAYPRSNDDAIFMAPRPRSRPENR